MNKTLKNIIIILIIGLTILTGWYLIKSLSSKEGNKSNINNSSSKSNQQINNSSAITTDETTNSTKEQTKEQNNSKHSKYLGYWYQSEEYLKDYNPSTINIKKVTDNQLIFDLYISRIANFDNVTIKISEERFEAISDNAVTKDNNQAQIYGYIRFINGKIIVLVQTSNIVGIDPNTNYIFTYKK